MPLEKTFLDLEDCDAAVIPSLASVFRFRAYVHTWGNILIGPNYNRDVMTWNSSRQKL